MPKNAASSAKPTVNIFWTSGWDSTYMLLQLLHDGYIVQPIYIVNPARRSRRFEIKAMSDIATAIQAHRHKHPTSLPGQILPLQMYNRNDITPDPDITQSYHTIREHVDLGYQYEYLARFAAEHHDKFPSIALGIERPNGEFSSCTAAVESNGAFVLQGDFMVLDLKQSTNSLKLLFQYFTFPIAEITEVQMLQNVKRWHFEDIMKHAWFCHKPIDGQPCGFCRPCQQKMECRMEWLLPEVAQTRYRHFDAFRRKHSNKFLLWLYDWWHHKFS